MKKSFKSVFLIILASIFCLSFFSCSKKNKKEIIGIVKYGSYEGLDLCYDSFMQALVDKIENLDSYKIEIYDANFSRKDAYNYGKKLVKNKAKVIITFGDGASLEVARATTGSGVKMVYSPTNNINMLKRWMNATGVLVPSDYDAQLNMVKEFFPTLPCVNIGIIVSKDYSEGGDGLKNLFEAANNHKMIVIEESVENKYEILDKARGMIATSVENPINCFLLLSDDIVSSGIEDLLKVADDANIPVFANDTYQLKYGCIASCNQYYKNAGAAMAGQVYEIFDKAYVSNIDKPNVNTLGKYYNRTAFEKCKNIHLKAPINISQYKDLSIF